MSNPFTAYRIHDNDGRITAGFEALTLADLDPGEVVIRAHYSSVNYKDALAATGAGKILRKSPLVGGIDVAGEVMSSEDERFKPGDAVLVTGCGIGESHDGGYSEVVRLPADWIVPLPPTLDCRSAMGLGTAGFTAALAIHKMEANGQRPEAGPIIVTGATGGVGGFAIDMLAGLGYAVTALTGKAEQADYLQQLGANDILLRQETDYGQRPLEKTRWAGAIDSVGGEALTWLTRTVGWWGNIASIGNAASPKLQTTVFPFILRGINLLGVNSMATPMPLRREVWERLGSDLKPRHLDEIANNEIPFADLPNAFQPMIDNKTRGRTVVRIG
jgi:NADPH2:quinone reductase